MSPKVKRQLAWQTGLATYSGICWLLALASWLATFGCIWRLFNATQHRLAEAGLACQGHCWLCGMSRGFRAIWGGRFAEAVAYNHYSVLLFAGMVIGCIYDVCLFVVFSRKLRRSTYATYKSPEPTAVGAFSSAVAVHAMSRR